MLIEPVSYVYTLNTVLFAHFLNMIWTERNKINSNYDSSLEFSLG